MKKRISTIFLVMVFIINIYGVQSYAGAVGPYDRPSSTINPDDTQHYAPGQQIVEDGKNDREPGTGGTVIINKPSSGFTGGSFSDPLENPGEYQPADNLNENNKLLIERGNLVIGILQVIGTAISVITLMTLGIRFMLASVQEKALYKETMGPYLIGAVMVFAIPNIIAILYDFITGNINVI